MEKSHKVIWSLQTQIHRRFKSWLTYSVVTIDFLLITKQSTIQNRMITLQILMSCFWLHIKFHEIFEFFEPLDQFSSIHIVILTNFYWIHLHQINKLITKNQICTHNLSHSHVFTFDQSSIDRQECSTLYCELISIWSHHIFYELSEQGVVYMKMARTSLSN